MTSGRGMAPVMSDNDVDDKHQSSNNDCDEAVVNEAATAAAATTTTTTAEEGAAESYLPGVAGLVTTISSTIDDNLRLFR